MLAKTEVSTGAIGPFSEPGQGHVGDTGEPRQRQRGCVERLLRFRHHQGFNVPERGAVVGLGLDGFDVHGLPR